MGVNLDNSVVVDAIELDPLEESNNFENSAKFELKGESEKDPGESRFMKFGYDGTMNMDEVSNYIEDEPQSKINSAQKDEEQDESYAQGNEDGDDNEEAMIVDETNENVNNE